MVSISITKPDPHPLFVCSCFTPAPRPRRRPRPLLRLSGLSAASVFPKFSRMYKKVRVSLSPSLPPSLPRPRLLDRSSFTHPFPSPRAALATLFLAHFLVACFFSLSFIHTSVFSPSFLQLLQIFLFVIFCAVRLYLYVFEMCFPYLLFICCFYCLSSPIFSNWSTRFVYLFVKVGAPSPSLPLFFFSQKCMAKYNKRSR